LHEVFAGRDQRELKLLDIGRGTGRFLDFAKQARPRLQILGLDMFDACDTMPSCNLAVQRTRAKMGRTSFKNKKCRTKRANNR
jgi:hypothetical protein